MAYLKYYWAPLYAISIWLGMSFASYGLALKSLSSWLDGQFDHALVFQARVTSVTPNGIGDDLVKFKAEGYGLDFLVPTAFIDTKFISKDRGYYLIRPGAVLNVKATQKGIVLELTVHPGTPYTRQIVIWDRATAKHSDFINGKMNMSAVYVILGILLPLLAGLLHRFVRRRLHA